MTIYRRSLSFILAFAAAKLFPKGRSLVIGHSLGNGYFYHLETGDNITPAEERDAASLEAALREIVASAKPIERRYVNWLEAVQHFVDVGEHETELLVRHHSESRVAVVICDGYLDLFHGPHLPNTRYLTNFELRYHAPGLLLRFPSICSPNEMPPFVDSPALFQVYQQHKQWGKILSVSCVGELNQLIDRGEIASFIQVAESLQERSIMEIARKIMDNPKCLLVLIAGPSSSGKTTFSRKLAIQLRVFGRKPLNLTLDDYYVPRVLTPLDESGNKDYEALEAIDLKQLNTDLLRLFAGEMVILPKYDFKDGVRVQGPHIQMAPGGILIVEGIHGLNERLTEMIPREQKYKIFISALTQLNLDDHNRIPTTDNRLIRRITRDFQHRGYSAEDTLERWPLVRAGEEKHIFPTQNHADIVFNSALDYELGALRVLAEPLLTTVKPSSNVYHEARRLLSFLRNFDSIAHDNIPKASILREFVGDSLFKDVV